jgi:UDP-N-acetylmuramate--alanine ligase
MTAEGVPVYDDYAHNPEKIASCIRMLSEITPGRLFVIFQPHGFGPLGFFRDELFETLEKTLKERDAFFMLPPFYAGGTSSFKPTSQEVIAQYKENASAPEKYHFADDREVLRTRILAEVQKGDLIVVMGARDNSLSLYANSFCKVSQA